MNALPIRIHSFRPRHQVYYIGVDYVPHENADKYYIAQALMNKVLQITSYCKKYGKAVTAMLTPDVPDFVAGMLSTLGVKLMSVVKDPISNVYGDFIVIEDPKKFLSEHTEVILVLKQEEDDYDLDTEKPIVFLPYPILVTREKRTDSSKEVVDNFKEVFRSNNDPYSVFDLGEQGRRVPDDYAKRIMVAPEPTGVPKPLKLGNS